MESTHSSMWAGHPGIGKMKEILTRKYFWPGMSKDIDRWVKCCTTCNLQKRVVARRRHPLVQEVCGVPFQRVAFDVIGPIPNSKSGYRYILMLVD